MSGSPLSPLTCARGHTHPILWPFVAMMPMDSSHCLYLPQFTCTRRVYFPVLSCTREVGLACLLI